MGTGIIMTGADGAMAGRQYPSVGAYSMPVVEGGKEPGAAVYKSIVGLALQLNQLTGNAAAPYCYYRVRQTQLGRLQQIASSGRPGAA